MILLKLSKSFFNTRSIFFAFVSIVLTHSFSIHELRGATECRNEKNEGWQWANSLSYSTATAELFLDFTDIHERLRGKHDIIRPFLKDQTKNICVAELNFIVTSGRTQEPAIADFQDVHDIPLGKHVFVSGSETVDLVDFSLVKGKAKEKGNRDQAKQEQPAHDLKKKYEFQQNFESKSGVSSDHTILSSIFINPEHKYFLEIEFLLKRIKERYAGVPAKKLSSIARLACQWESTQKTSGKFRRFFKKLCCKSTIDLNSSKNYADWFAIANNPGPNHSGSKDAECGAKCESKFFFFTNAEDSEQKLFYYLSYVTGHFTGYVTGYVILKELCDEIDDYYKSSMLYRTKTILEIMHLCNPQCNKIRQEVSFDGHARDLDKETFLKKELEKLRDHCARLKKQKGSNDFVLDTFENHVTEVLGIFESLITMDIKKIVEHSSQSAMQQQGMETAKKLYASRSKNSEGTEAVINARYQGENSVSNKTFQKSLQAARSSLFSEITKHDHFTFEQLIVDFDVSLEKVLFKYPLDRVSAVVLNIHSSFDACYRCAPDLARETLRKDSFANYFLERVRHFNLKHKRGNEGPFFRIIYSCDKIRKDVRCSHCSYDAKVKVSPVWSKPDKIAYYQYYFPVSDTEEVSGNDSGVRPTSKKEQAKKRTEDLNELSFFGNPDDNETKPLIDKTSTSSERPVIKESKKKKKQNDDDDGDVDDIKSDDSSLPDALD